MPLQLNTQFPIVETVFALAHTTSVQNPMS